MMIGISLHKNFERKIEWILSTLIHNFAPFESSNKILDEWGEEMIFQLDTERGRSFESESILLSICLSWVKVYL